MIVLYPDNGKESEAKSSIWPLVGRRGKSGAGKFMRLNGLAKSKDEWIICWVLK